MPASDERKKAQARERMRRYRERKRQQAELPREDDELMLPDTELARGVQTSWQPSADRSAMPRVKQILRRPGYATQVIYESPLTPDPGPEPAPTVNRAERLRVWLQRTPPDMHGDYSRRLAWATQRVAEELGEMVVSPMRGDETWDEIVARNAADANYQPPRGYAIRGFLDKAGKLIARHDRPPMPFGDDYRADESGESIDGNAIGWRR
jgi:hypothetical protein